MFLGLEGNAAQRSSERITGGCSFFVVLPCVSSAVLREHTRRRLALTALCDHVLVGSQNAVVLVHPSFIVSRVRLGLLASVHPESRVSPADVGASYSFGADLSLTRAHLISPPVAVLGTPPHPPRPLLCQGPSAEHADVPGLRRH